MSNMKRHAQADPAVVEITYNEHGLPAGIEDMDEAGLQALADSLNAKLLNRKGLPQAPAFDQAKLDHCLAANMGTVETEYDKPAGAALTAEQLAAAAERLAQNAWADAGKAAKIGIDWAAKNAERQANCTATETIRPETMPAVVRPRPSAVAFPIQSVEGFENFTAADLIMPRLAVVQMMTKNVQPQDFGLFRNSLTHEVTPTAALVFLRWTQTRVKFQEGNFTPSGLECWSRDGVAPDVESRGLYAQDCSLCPMSRWGVDGKRPPCHESRTFLCIDTATEEPIMFSCSGTALKEAKRLITNLGFRKKPLYSYTINLTTELVQGDKGRWYIPVMAAEQMPPEAVAKYREFYTSLKGLEITPDTEANPESSEA